MGVSGGGKSPCPCQRVVMHTTPKTGRQSTFKGDKILKQGQGTSRTRVKIKINFESEQREVGSSPYMASRIAVKQGVISSVERREAEALLG